MLKMTKLEYDARFADILAKLNPTELYQTPAAGVPPRLNL
jgi:hypothetical protein